MTLRRPAAAGHPADSADAAPAMPTKSLESRALLLARELHLPWRKPTAGTKAMIPSLIEDVNLESLIRQENLPQICSTADRTRRHRPEGRRDGKEGVRSCRSWWWRQ